jgi:nucleobase:cation symporter-1, NCS1 family
MTTGHSPALIPVADDQRVFTGVSHASLWFSLGVGLLVMQVGAYLVPAVGTKEALLAIVIGSVLGSGLLAWAAQLGCQTGLTSAGLIHTVYGPSFARLPVLLNVLQLVGWTSFELVVMRDGTQAIVKQVTGIEGSVVVWTLLWGGVLTLLMTGSMLTLVRRFVSRVGLPLVILSLLWLSWHFLGLLQQQGVQAFVNRPGDGSMGMLAAIDLVIAMPVSWLPLVADYARHGKSSASTLRGTWIGYAVANAWCYALGVLVASVANPGTDLVTALLLAQGGLLALGLILLDELDNAYGDVYSGSVSLSSLTTRPSLRQLGVGMAVLCTLLACVLPMHSIEPFLLMLSSVFVPLYGVILGQLAGRKPGASAVKPCTRCNAAVWILGVIVFHSLATFAPVLGATLPTLLLTLGLAVAMRTKAAS